MRVPPLDGASGADEQHDPAPGRDTWLQEAAIAVRLAGLIEIDPGASKELPRRLAK